MRPESLTSTEKDKNVTNLFINRERTLSAMAKIEGDAWLKNQGRQAIAEALDYLSQFPDEPDASYEIYGANGVRRWRILADGSVEFSKHHCGLSSQEQEEKVNEVKNLGFEIY